MSRTIVPDECAALLPTRAVGADPRSYPGLRVRPRSRVVALEATNNAAERAIRPWVLWRKGRLGTQSPSSRFVEVIMTVVAMLKQQHRNVLDYVTAVCKAVLRGEASPSLIPTSADRENLMCPAA
jgi:hypothetical protein